MWSWKVTLSQTVPCGIPERTSPSNSMTEYKTWFLGSLHKVRWDGSIYMERRMQEPTTLISSKLSHLPHQMSVWSCSCYLQRFPNTYAPPVLIRPELAFTAVYAYQGLLTINRREGYCSLCFSHPSSLSLLDLPTPHPCQAFTNTFYILAQQSYCETAAFNMLFASLQLLSGQGDQQTQAAKK